MPKQQYENLALGVAGGVATITLDRPGGRNAFDTVFYAEVRSAVREAEVDPTVTGIVIDSASENFAVGGDLKEMLGYLGGGGGDGPQTGDGSARTTGAVDWDLWKFRDSLPFETIRACRKPTLAIVDGICCGGGFATAISCDFVLASPRSRFGTPETKVGLMDGLVPAALFGHVPLPLLKYLLFSGELIDATYAQAAGIVFEVTAAERLHARAGELLASFAASGGRIIADYKRTLRSYELPVDYEDTMRGLYTDPAIQGRVRSFFTKPA